MSSPDSSAGLASNNNSNNKQRNGKKKKYDKAASPPSGESKAAATSPSTSSSPADLAEKLAKVEGADVDVDVAVAAAAAAQNGSGSISSGSSAVKMGELRLSSSAELSSPTAEETENDSDKQQQQRQHNGGDEKVVPRKSKKKTSKNSKRRSSKEKDVCLVGWSGDYPNLSSALSVESSSDLEHQQSPAELKAISSTGLSVFPREEQTTTTTTLELTTTTASTVTTTTATATAVSNNNNNSSTSTSQQQEPEPEQQQQQSVAVAAQSSSSSPQSAQLPRKRAASVAAKEDPPPIEEKRSRSPAASKSKEVEVEVKRKLERSKSEAGQDLELPTARSTRSRSMCAAFSLVKEQAQDMGKQDAVAPTPIAGKKSPRSRPNSTLNLALKLPASDEFYKKPFEHGWKRELVLRSSGRADVFFITPAGKKIRSRDDILPLLKPDEDLAIEHFCFMREAQGVGIEFELVRQTMPAPAQRKSHQATAASTPSSSAAGGTSSQLVSGKRVPKPKTPKGASPPPEGWTATMAVKGNARVLAASNGNSAAASLASSSGQQSSNSRKRSHASKSRSKPPPAASKPISPSVKAGSEKVAAVAAAAAPVNCLRCHELIDDPSEAYKFATTKNENTCHICLRCLKTSSYDEATPAAAEEKTVAQVAANGNAAAANNNEVNTTEDDEPKEKKTKKEDGDALEIAEEIELPGQLPPAQLLSSDASLTGGQVAAAAAAVAKREPKIQDIVVISGRKYLTVAGEPPRPRVQVRPRSPDVEPYDKYYYKRLWPKEVSNQFVDYVSNASTAGQLLMGVMKVLSMKERSNMAQVCKTWYLVSRESTVWRSISLKGALVNDWNACLGDLARMKTRELDMVGMRWATPSQRLTGDLSMLVPCLRSLRTDTESNADFVQSAIEKLPQLHELYANTAKSSAALSLEKIGHMSKLRILHIKMLSPRSSLTQFKPLKQLSQLKELSIRGVSNIKNLPLLELQHLGELQTLVLGSCLNMDAQLFGSQVLPKLLNLRRLRLENQHSTTLAFPIAGIMEGLALSNCVVRLELINVDVDGRFSQQLTQCSKVRELLLMPNYINNAAKTTNAVMQAISDNAESLKKFKLGLTAELLRMTGALCSPKEKGKEKQWIPVVRPVPGVVLNDRLNDVAEGGNAAVREWAFLPVERLESILHHMMPQAMLTVAKVPHSETVRLRF